MLNVLQSCCQVVTPNTALAIAARSNSSRWGRLPLRTSLSRDSCTKVIQRCGTSHASLSPSTTINPRTLRVPRISHAQSICRSSWSRIGIHVVFRVGSLSVRLPSITMIVEGVCRKTSGYEGPSRMYHALSGKGSQSSLRRASSIIDLSHRSRPCRFSIVSGSLPNDKGGSDGGFWTSHFSNPRGGRRLFSCCPQQCSLISPNAVAEMGLPAPATNLISCLSHVRPVESRANKASKNGATRVLLEFFAPIRLSISVFHGAALKFRPTNPVRQEIVLARQMGKPVSFVEPGDALTDQTPVAAVRAGAGRNGEPFDATL